MKKSSILLSMMLILLVSACADKAAQVPPLQQYSIDQFMNTTSIFGSSFSPDESKILFTSDESGIYNAYTVSVMGGEAEQVTFSDSNSIFITSYFPEDERFLFRSDKGGNEIWHIYLYDNGDVRDLTPGEEARSTFFGWSKDKKSFFYQSNLRDARYNDLYEMEIGSLESRMIFQNDEGYNISAISHSKRLLALSKTITTHNSDMYLFDRERLSVKHLSQHKGDINYRPVGFSLDNSLLYYLTDENSEFTYLKSYSIKDDVTKAIEKKDWDIMYSYYSKKENYRISGINNDASTEIIITDVKTGEPLALPELPNADIRSVNMAESESKMTFYVNGSGSPSNLYIYDLKSREYRKLTDSMNKDIIPEHLVESTVVRYKSFDGMEIPAVLYTPHQATDGKVPALVWVHGGPGGQSRVGYNPLIQYLVNHGYAILAVNNRGSSGYGRTFYKADDLNHGQGDLQDCIYGKKYMIESGLADADKVGIIGGSYGGYMVLAALAFQPEAFELGVNIFGVSNWLRTLKSIPPWWEAFREALYKELGNPETDEEYLRSISPLFHADKIQRPLMVLQGANDPRVLKIESDEIVDAVRKNNVPVEYVLFDDEGHGFSKKENKIEAYKGILAFLNYHMKKGS
ncbi:MAG: S9 family peptidase [Calditrichia bacterium]